MTIAARRIPLRIVDPRLLRKAWSEGRTYYQGVYETLPPRGIEKPLEEQTLDDMVGATERRPLAEIIAELKRSMPYMRAPDYAEPISESRRCWLTTGQKVESLHRPASPDSPRTWLDIVADDGPRGLVDVIIEDDDPDDEEYDAPRMTPYTTVSPTAQKQIFWEQCKTEDGPAYKMRLASSEAGRLTVTNTGRGILPGRLSFLDIATSALRSFFASVGRVETLDDLHARVALVRDVLDDPMTGKHFSADATEESERYSASPTGIPADRIVHNSYEELNDDGDLIIHHRSAQRSPWELWHNSITRNSSDPLEFGFDLISNVELESLLDVTDCKAGEDCLFGHRTWDENDNVLVPTS